MYSIKSLCEFGWNIERTDNVQLAKAQFDRRFYICLVQGWRGVLSFTHCPVLY